MKQAKQNIRSSAEIKQPDDLMLVRTKPMFYDKVAQFLTAGAPMKAAVEMAEKETLAAIRAKTPREKLLIAIRDMTGDQFWKWVSTWYDVDNIWNAIESWNDGDINEELAKIKGHYSK